MESEQAADKGQQPTLVASYALATCSSFVAVGFYSISVALSPIHENFAADPRASWLLPLVGGIVPLAFAVSSPLIGRLIERLGVRTIFVGSLLLLAAAGVGPAFLTDLLSVVVLRALVGVAVAGILNAGITGAGLLPEPRRSRMFGTISTLGGISGIICFPLAGVLASWSWRAVFAIPLVALAVIPFALHLPQSTGHPVENDVPQSGAGAPASLLLPAAFLGLVTYAAPMFSPFYLRDIGLTSPAFVSFPLMAMSVCSLLGSGGYGFWLRRFGRRRVFVAGYALIGTALVIAGNAPSLFLFVGAMAVFGVGLGCLYPNLNATAVSLGREQAARIVGNVNASLYGAQVLFPYIAAPIRSHAGNAAVFLVFGALSMAIAAWFLLDPRLTAPHR